MRKVTAELLQAIYFACSEGHPITLDASAGMDVHDEIIRLRLELASVGDEDDPAGQIPF